MNLFLLLLALDSAVLQHHKDSEAPYHCCSLLEPCPQYCGCVPLEPMWTIVFLVTLRHSSQSLYDKSSRAIFESLLQVHQFLGVIQSGFAMNGGVKLFPKALLI